MVFYRKKNPEVFQHRYMWQIFSRMRLKLYFLLKITFRLNSRLFIGKNQKKFKVGKVRKYDEETEYFVKKNRFHPSKRRL